MTVYKQPTSNLVESGLAGEINLQTLRPLDYNRRSTSKYFGTVNVTDTYDPQPHRGSPEFNGVLGVKLFDGTLGAYVSGVYSNQYSKTNRIQEYQGLHNLTIENPDGSTYVRDNVGTIDGFSPSLAYREYDKRSFAAGVQWRPSDALEVNLDGEWNRFTTANDNHGGDFYTGFNFFGGATPPIFTPGSYTIRGNQLIAYNDALINRTGTIPDTTGATFLRDQNHNDFWNAGINVVWHIDSRDKVAFDYGHGNSFYLDNWRSGGPGCCVAPGNPFATTYTPLNAIFDGSGQYPAVTILQSGGTNIEDPSDYGQAGIFSFQDLTRQKRDQFRLDFDRQLNDNFTLHAGARYADTTFKTVLAYGPGIAYPYVPSGPMFDGQHVQFYGYNMPWPDVSYNGFCSQPGVYYYCSVHNDGYGSFAGFGLPTNPAGDPSDKFAFQAPQSGRLYETNHAYYVQMDADGELFGLESSGNAGVRAVRIGEQGLSYQGTTYAYSFGGGPDPKYTALNSSTLFADSNSYWEILPTVNLLVKPRHNMNVRFGAAKTMSLAEFPALIPNVSLQIFTPYNGAIAPSQLSAGNLHLRPTSAWNYDFTVEYYTDYDAAYVASLFYKKVKDLTATVTNINTPLPSQYAPLLPPGRANSGFIVSLPINANNGYTDGLELGTNQPFTFLPSPWDGFGLQANYTYVASTLHIQGDTHSTSFPGSSKHNVNTTFYYDKNGWDARLAYAWRNDYLSAVAALDQSTYTYAYSTLDASLSKSIGDHLEVMVSAANLTDSPIIQYIGSGRMFAGYYQRPRTYSLGVRARF